LSFVQASSPGADGFIDTPNQRISVQHVLPISTPKDLSQVPIEDTKGGKDIPLGSVTTVVEDHPALIGDAALPSGPGFLLVVEKFPGANTLAVTKGIEDAMSALAPGLTGITVDTSVYRPATYITSALHNVGLAALVGLLLVTLWLGLAWASWRVALIGFVATVLAYVATAYLLYLRGTTFNALILCGLVLAIGVVVDDIVSGVAAMKQRLAEGPNQGQNVGSNEGAVGAIQSKADLIRAATVEMRKPLWFAAVILVLTTLPIVLLQGFSGAFARPMILTYVLALVVSTVVAVVVTPVLGLFLLSTAEHERHSTRIASWIRSQFDRRVPDLVRRGGWALAAVAVLGLMALAIAPQLGHGTLIPQLQDRNLVVKWTAMDGTSLPEMQRITTTAADDMRALAGVGDASTNIGQAQFGDQIVDVNSAETWVTIKPGANYAATLAAIRRIADDYPGVAHDLSTYPAQAIGDGQSDSATPLTVRLYGTDQRALTAEAEQIRQGIAGIKGIRNPTVALPATEPSIQIDVNVSAAAKYGLKPGDIRRDSAVLVSGIPVGSYYQGQQIFDVAVWADPAQRDNLTAIQNLPIDTPDGKQVRLKDVAAVTIQPALPVIDHDQVSRYLDIHADVDGSIAAARGRVDRLLAAMPLPFGYHAETFSDLADRKAADRRTLWYSLAALAVLYLLLQAVLRSWGRALLLFLMLPLAAAGGALTSLIAGSSITVGALAGFLILFGIAVRHGILLMQRIRQLEQQGAAAPADGEFVEPAPGVRSLEHVLTATRERAFPLIVTAVGVALAVLPFLIRGTVPGVELLRPLALVVLGGLITTVLVLLVVLPALYQRFVVGTPPPQRASTPPSTATATA
jgi:Cu/Ag efflux pump CusA